MTPSRKLHQNDKLWGAVAEALIAAYALRSEGGKLSSYRPFTDVDGKNIVIDLVGGGSRTSTSRSSAPLASTEMVGGTVRRHRDRIPSSPKFVFIFCLLDRRKMELTRIRVIPSADFYKRAYRTLLPKEMIQFNFDYRTAGDERWEEFEVTRAELGAKLVELIRAAGKKERRTRVNRREQLDGRWLQLVA